MPLADVAARWTAELARETGAPRLAQLDGGALLGERAALAALRVPGRVSAGGGCRLYDAADGAVALNLARPEDRELLPALFECDATSLDVAEQMRLCAAAPLVVRGRSMGLAIAALHERPSHVPACSLLTQAPSRPSPLHAPRIVDLSALWAGPLAAHLLTMAGAKATKVESLTRPDAMREGDAALFGRLNGGKRQIQLDLGSLDGRDALLALIAECDIVIEAARPRALRQLGIDADAIVRSTPGLTWITITGHGASGEEADWIGFGDDCGVAAGLSAALRDATGQVGFVSDAIADPLTGIRAAGIAWRAWASGRGGRWGLSMRSIAAEALAQAQASDPFGLNLRLRDWGTSEGAGFPDVPDRPC